MSDIPGAYLTVEERILIGVAVVAACLIAVACLGCFANYFVERRKKKKGEEYNSTDDGLLPPVKYPYQKTKEDEARLDNREILLAKDDHVTVGPSFIRTYPANGVTYPANGVVFLPPAGTRGPVNVIEGPTYSVPKKKRQKKRVEDDDIDEDREAGGLTSAFRDWNKQKRRKGKRTKYEDGADDYFSPVAKNPFGGGLTRHAPASLLQGDTGPNPAYRLNGGEDYDNDWVPTEVHHTRRPAFRQPDDVHVASNPNEWTSYDRAFSRHVRSEGDPVLLRVNGSETPGGQAWNPYWLAPSGGTPMTYMYPMMYMRPVTIPTRAPMVPSATGVAEVHETSRVHRN